MLLFLTIPVTLFLGFFGKPLIKLLFERGAFSASDTSAVYSAFSIYIVALPAMVIGTVLGQGYYVLKDTRTVAIIGVGEMVFYVFLCYAFLKSFGYLSIPIALATQFNLGALLCGLILRYKLGNKGGTTILSSMAKHVAAALVPLSGVIIFFGFKITDSMMTMALIPVFFVTYFLISRFLFFTDEAISICDKITEVFIKLRHSV